MIGGFNGPLVIDCNRLMIKDKSKLINTWQKGRTWEKFKLRLVRLSIIIAAKGSGAKDEHKTTNYALTRN